MIGGTLPLQSRSRTRVLNANCVYAPDGTLAARYDKMHLFRYDNGREAYDEARVLLAGSDAGRLRSRSAARRPERLLRPALSRAVPGADAAAVRRCSSVPSAFTYTTGQAHWELLLRARAVENQCYVLAPAQGGKHENGRRTWGHSMVVDPWGEVLDGATRGRRRRDRRARPGAHRRGAGQLPALEHRGRVGAR